METKRCPRCGRNKSLSSFNKNRGRKDGLQRYCRKCDNAHRREWYSRVGYGGYLSPRIRQSKRERRAWLDEIKSKLSCEKCGEDHPATLDFHHRDPKQKDRRISQMIASGSSRERMLKEIEKCSVLCANCHRKLHYEETHGPIAQR